LVDRAIGLKTPTRPTSRVSVSSTPNAIEDLPV
jgi:hypothetical protein